MSIYSANVPAPASGISSNNEECINSIIGDALSGAQNA